MLRSEQSIREDTIGASQKEKEALHQCLYIIKQFTEEEIKCLIKQEQETISIIKGQRSRWGFKKYRKVEFKQAKTHLKWLKYLIIKPKRTYLKSTQSHRKNK